MFNRVLIIGVGLIGSSIGMNLIRKKMAREVIGVGRNRVNLKEAIRRRAIHRSVQVQEVQSLLKEFTDKDLIILAVPVREILHYITLLSRLKKAPLVIDVGSTKLSIVKAARKKSLRFIGCHPIAGTEKSGAGAGEMGLFRGRQCILTPFGNSRDDIAKIRKFWSGLGSEVTLMDAGRHDRLLAVVSHLPHTAAYSLMRAVGKLISKREVFQFAFGGLRGTTRVAASSPEMWRDIFLENRGQILPALGCYIKELEALRDSISRRDSGRIHQFLKRAREDRLKFP